MRSPPPFPIATTTWPERCSPARSPNPRRRVNPCATCLRVTARSTGRQVGEQSRAAREEAVGDDRRAEFIGVLESHGYEPVTGADDEIALANCPFHRLAEQQRELVCGMNLDFLGGVLEGIGPDDHLTARLDPVPDYCCVRIGPS